MNSDGFKFTPTGNFITVNSGDGVLAAATLRNASTNYIEFKQPKCYDFTPQDDITPLELAWLTHYWAWASINYFSGFEHPQWQLIGRHFTEVK